MLKSSHISTDESLRKTNILIHDLVKFAGHCQNHGAAKIKECVD